MRSLTANSIAEAYRIDGGRDLLNASGVMGVSAIDIRVLGPVEFDGPAGPAALGGPRQRALFGLLALRAPKVVSQDALLDGIWGEDPPPSGIRNLHAHVAYLRRALAKAGAEGLIVTRPPGYALLVDPGVVDVHRFADLTQRTGEPEALREALALWRGDLLAGCPVQGWADAEAARLHEARLTAIEALANAEIRAGRGGPMIAELESLVANHPLRERFWELLMLALAREDRQGDALRVYQRARSTLVEELGVEPGHRLRQLEAAVHRGDLGPPEEPADTSVPAPLTSLIGREAEISELTGRLITHRLVTLTGVGGSGKTRLAVEICAAYPGDVRFVDLTPVRDDVAGALCAKLGLREETGAVDTVIRHLRPHATLLVLDNCEHLIAACSALAERLLRACPKLRILATSRESLGVLGEVAWPVSGLAVPPADAPSLTEARRYDAVRLFLDRAAVPAVRALTDADAPVLTEICRRLDGLPLAVELAAARTSVLTVAEIAARIHDPALLRDSGNQSRPHHRALDATVAFSYELLEPEARALFRTLAVFVGGFTLEAACALRPDALEPLANLATKSLIVVERDRDSTRYRLLETIRHFAVERLAEYPDEAARARAAHAAHFLALAEETDRRLRGPGQQAAMDRCTAEAENLAAAKEWFAEHDRIAGLRLAVALARFHRLRGTYEKGRVWLDEALEGTDRGPLAAAAFLAAAFLAFFELAYRQAAAHAERALAEFHEVDDHAGEGRALRLLGSIARVRGQYEQALAWYDKAQANYGQRDEPGIADVRQMAGFTAWLSGDLDRAERLLDQALLYYQSAKDTESAASTRIHLAMVAFHRGELARARTLAEDALTTFTEFGFQEGIAWSYNVLGLVALRTGDGADAVLKLRTSLEIHCRLGDRWRQPSLIDALAASALEAGDARRAASLTGLADRLRDVPGIPIPTQEAALRADTVERTRRVLGEERYYESYSDGRRLHPEDVARPVMAGTGTSLAGTQRGPAGP